MLKTQHSVLIWLVLLISCPQIVLAECADLTVKELVVWSKTIIEGEIVGKKKTTYKIDGSMEKGIEYKIKTLKTLKGKSKKIYTGFEIAEDAMLLEQVEYFIGNKFIFFGEYGGVSIATCPTALRLSDKNRQLIKSLMKKSSKKSKPPKK